MATFKDTLTTASSPDDLPSPAAALPLPQTSPTHSVTQANSQASQTLEAVRDIVYGSTAGILGKFVEYPFDTVKVRLQSQPSVPLPGQPHLAGPVSAFAAAFRSPEGPLASLYRGISAPLLGAAVETSSLFFSYRVAQDALISFTPTLRAQRDASPPGTKVELPFSALLACGAASGAFTSLLLTPIELVKCKMQVPVAATSTAPPTPLQLIRAVLHAHGVLGLWHGQLGTLIRETGGSAAWFGSYEAVKLLFVRTDPDVHSVADVKVHQQMMAGAAAGMSYNFVFYPADTIKSRMQTADALVGAKPLSFGATATQLWREGGLRAFYRGCGITVFRAAPSSAIIFSIYEALRKTFG